MFNFEPNFDHQISSRFRTNIFLAGKIHITALNILFRAKNGRFRSKTYGFKPKTYDFESKCWIELEKRKNSSRFQMNMFSILKSTIFNFEQKWPNSKQNFRFQAENRQFSMKNVLFKSKTKMFSKNIKK